MKPPYELVQEFWEDKLMTIETKQEMMKVVEGIVWFTMERCAKIAEADEECPSDVTFGPSCGSRVASKIRAEIPNGK